MKYKELFRILKDHGCEIKRHGSSHDIWFSPINDCLFPVGRHGSQEVPKGTLNSILKEAGIN